MPDVQPLRCAVFGGSFDPIHEGHVAIARAAQKRFDLERIVWMPASQPPHKLDRELAPAHLRLAMCLIATSSERSWEVMTIELGREGPSYTYDTLLEVPDHLRPRLVPKKDGGIAERRRELELYLVLGSDNLLGLPKWKNAEDVVTMARPIVAWRGDAGETPDSLLAKLDGRMPETCIDRLRRGFMRIDPIPYSSTAIRAALAEGRVPEGALNGEVLEFIQEKGLYGWPLPEPEPEVDPADRDPLGGDPDEWRHPQARTPAPSPLQVPPLDEPQGEGSGESRAL